MTLQILEKAAAAISQVQTRHAIGRVSGVSSAQVRVTGLSHVCRLGDPVNVLSTDNSLPGEVVYLADNAIEILLDGPTDGIRLGDPVKLLRRRYFAPDDTWIGRIIDPDGAPLDGAPAASRACASAAAGTATAGPRTPRNGGAT